ncbi:hypothetical protein L204_100902 [Cryptococcus depauperatus]|nr:hypothetical protein L204_01165 [Cryptococcus depauperatus CBS 7855]
MASQQICQKCGLLRSPPSSLEIMFEEDFQRCFICQTPSKGLYCSSDCRLKDQGALASHAVPERPVITSQVPPALSPYVRPANGVGLSPRSSGQPRPTSHSSSSASSSAASSPLQSPRTNFSEADSPQKHIFNLPPPAYPTKMFSAQTPSSLPMKIPNFLPKASPLLQATGTLGSQGSTVYPIGASIDTLRFGRRPGAVNSVTSPNALLPRCACGLPANHKNRSQSKDRADIMESGFSRLSLGSAMVTREEPSSRPLRIVSDSAIPPFTLSPKGKDEELPAIDASEPAPISERSLVASGSLLSRSHSDPIPLIANSYAHTVVPAPAVSKLTPSRLEPSPERHAAAREDSRPSRQGTHFFKGSSADSARGRSRERQEHQPVMTGSNGILNHPPDREQAPSRSRNRRDSHRRSKDRSRSRARERMKDLDLSRNREPPTPQRSPVSLRNNESPQILPSWSRSTSITDVRKNSEGVVVPVMRRNGSGKKKLAKDDEDKQKQEELRATIQFGQVFGVAAG